MTCSFTKLGHEECEECQKHKLHLRSIGQALSDNRNDEANHRVKRVRQQQILATWFIDKPRNCGETACEQCAKWDVHHEEYTITRQAYKADKEEAARSRDGNKVILSVDMQKVILLPRMTQFKTNVFTRRLVVINQTFAPINKKKSHGEEGTGSTMARRHIRPE